MSDYYDITDFLCAKTNYKPMAKDIKWTTKFILNQTHKSRANGKESFVWISSWGAFQFTTDLKDKVCLLVEANLNKSTADTDDNMGRISKCLKKMGYTIAVDKETFKTNTQRFSGERIVNDFDLSDIEIPHAGYDDIDANPLHTEKEN